MRLVVGELEKLIVTLEEEMFAAAEELRFEYAAKLRDEIKELRRELVAAVLLVVAYRRFVQKRPITGPDALRFPDRGFGVDRYRDQLRRVGVDPDKASPLAASAAAAPATATPPAPGEERTAPEILEKLSDLHDAGVLTDDEYETARRRYLETPR